MCMLPSGSSGSIPNHSDNVLSVPWHHLFGTHCRALYEMFQHYPNSNLTSRPSSPIESTNLSEKRKKTKSGMSVHGLLNVDRCMWIGIGREWREGAVGGVGGGGDHAEHERLRKRRGRIVGG